MLAAATIRQVMPYAGARADLYAAPIAATMSEFDIDDTLDRQAAFLAQIAHESSELNRVVENMKYTAGRMMTVWPSRFPTIASAMPFVNRPEKLANFVYANRGGNGNEASSDGWRHRGAGLIQLTFKDTQLACAEHFGIPREKIVDWLRSPSGAARSAGWFWSTRRLNAMADQDRFREITRVITGGTTGLAERIEYWERAKRVLAK